MSCKIRFIGLWVLCSLFVSAQAGKWTTYFAYNNVTQIAMSSDKVFAVSDGSLFSVDKMSEEIKVYNRQTGLHGTGITCIHYDNTGEQLIICYGTGKIDMLSASGVTYVGGLYDKDMTQRKTIYNVTLKGRTAYLSTHYGVQTMDLRENKLVDSYWLRPNGEETPIKDVLLTNDSIYAFADDSLYIASLATNLSDYTFWKREARSNRIQPDANKGYRYEDETSTWLAGGADGIVRQTATDSLSYKPDGPLNNNPYYLNATDQQVIMLSGGRWASQYNTPGNVMRLIDGKWHNTTATAIQAKTGYLALDFMNAAIDRNNESHYYITSYGTGLYEFQGDSCVNNWLADGTIIGSAASNTARYTRLLGARYDSKGVLWFLDAGNVPNHLIGKDGDEFFGVPVLVNGQPFFIEIPADLIIDSRNENYKWIGVAHKATGVLLLDDKGTPKDPSDDETCMRHQWTNQHGRQFKPQHILAMIQDKRGRIWIATDQGVAYIDANTDYFNSDAIVQPDLMDGNGENPLISQRIKGICETPEGEIWIGSQSLGVYVLNADATEIVKQYTTDNSALPSNGILSLACAPGGKVYIGTAEGLVEYDPDSPGEALDGNHNDNEDLDMGSMEQWRLHLSYTDPQELAATPQRIYASANGSLFSVNRKDETIEYWNKSTGLSGSSVSHIAYDANAGKLIIAYENGQIDLLSDNGDVVQMPDISMKAGSMAVTVNNICVGSHFTYLSMPFGILAVKVSKGEVTDTYYIGDEAATIDIQQVAELGDSLYAFSYDRMYKAALKDPLVDYNYWQHEALPFEKVQQVAVYDNTLYVLYNDSLYRRQGGTWSLVESLPIAWMHVSGSQLLAYQRNKGLFRLTDEGWRGICDKYAATDAVFTQSEYWLTEEGRGIIHLGTESDDIFVPEGPMSNFGYHMDIVHDQLYVAPGGRWATQYGRQSNLSIYDGTQWRGISWPDTWYYANHDIRDAVQYAVDANDPGHFFVTTYGTGVFEFKNYKAVKHYDSANSSLRKANETVSDYYYTRTDGAMMDEQGNLWVLNATTLGRAVHILTPLGQWVSLPLISVGNELSFETPAGIWVDRRHSNWKWLVGQRGEPQLVLLDDGGTPTYNGDDKCRARNTFVDQNSRVITPVNFRCFAQDFQNRIWIGTEKGIILIPSTVDFFTSNSCRRIIIPRNDGTGLGDYLLGDEQINCMAVDGGNRIWIGTANSGLYLIEDDTITVKHFTESNSLLPSNSVQSIAIMPKTGEVFVGTDKGIASYRSDASEAQPDMSGAYAFPNPVRPNYDGYISIAGLMDNTVVNIVDAGGNLVCKTRSHGGMAVWDGKLSDGRRATPGIYTALCNAVGGHTVVKIMVIR